MRSKRHAEPRLPILEVLRPTAPVPVVAAAFMIQSTVAYVFIAYLASYGTTAVGVSRSTVLSSTRASSPSCSRPKR